MPRTPGNRPAPDNSAVYLIIQSSRQGIHHPPAPEHFVL
jgi:hypothetical protein